MILWRAGFRNVLRHPWQTVLAVIGVALGVGVVTAVDLANESAHRAFRIAAETVAGRATHQVVGGPAGLTDELYRTLRVTLGMRRNAPVVEGYVQVAGKAGTTLRLIGIDPFAEPPIRAFSSHFSSGKVLEALMTAPNTGMLLRQTAERLGIKEGGTFDVEVHGTVRQLVLAGFLTAGDELSRLGLDSLLVTDLATAQELLGMEGRLSRIDLVIPDGDDGARLLEKIRTALPAGAAIVPAGSRAGSLDQMTRAFRLNLTALSLLALVVGMFLIYNTTIFSVIRRRRLIGMLRAIGVTRREVFALICSEAFLIGLAGTAAGLVFGVFLGEELTRLVSRTISDLYFVLEVRGVPLLSSTIAKAVLLGLGATLAAAVPPALEATGAPPRAVLSRSDLEARRRKNVPLAALAGVLTMASGGGLLLVESGGITTSFAGLFFVIIGYALLVPGVIVLMSRAFRPVMTAMIGVLGSMAARGVVVSLSRTGVATAALVVAVSATIGVGIMVGSFRSTVERWLESWLRADIYVTTVGTGSGRNKPPLDPALVERLSRVPGAATYSLTRRVTLESDREPTDLFALEVPRSTFVSYRFKEGTPDDAWASFASGASVIVSEPYAYRHRLHRGDLVTLRTSRGERAFPISGVFYDYGSDAGIISICRAAYLRWWDDPSVDGMGFYAGPGVTSAELVAQIRARTGTSRVGIISNRELRDASVAVFDRTFAITGVLRLLTMVVAFVGILSALMAMMLERGRELAVLRAVGLTPRQLWGVICGETVLIGTVAGLLSVPLGLLQAFVLIYVVNRRSFGWTMDVAVEPAILVQAVALSLAAAVLAGVYPALAIARTSPALALKEEE